MTSKQIDTHLKERENRRYCNMLPQEIFAEALWLEWDFHGVPVSIAKIHTLLQRYNLKPKRDTTDNDLSLIIGRALKHCRTHTAKEEIDKIAEETDRLCTIARYDMAVAKYSHPVNQNVDKILEERKSSNRNAREEGDR